MLVVLIVCVGMWIVLRKWCLLGGMVDLIVRWRVMLLELGLLVVSIVWIVGIIYWVWIGFLWWFLGWYFVVVVVLCCFVWLVLSCLWWNFLVFWWILDWFGGIVLWCWLLVGNFLCLFEGLWRVGKWFVCLIRFLVCVEWIF